jgi:dihydrolipoamide dehydrogenase
MAAQDEYDVIVLGAGPSGENAAARAAAGALETAIVEPHLAGGECSYYACMPSKALLRPGQALDEAGRVPGASAAVTGELDVDDALARRNELASHWQDDGQVDWAQGEGIAFVRGHGRLAGERRVEVTGDEGGVQSLTARRAVVIATGTEAAIPPIDGLAEARPWDNTQATTAKEVPRRLLVLGGGVVGVELAQAWHSLGAEEVTIVEQKQRLLPGEEPFVGHELAEALQGQGIAVRTGQSVTAVSRPSRDAPVTATLDDGTRLTGDEILVAVGRRPNTADLGLETVGLERGASIAVDDQLRATSVDGEWLYAVGDVNGRTLLTHMGKYQARTAGDHIAGKSASAWADHRTVPRAVFTDPQVAAVGLTEQGARAAGMRVTAVTHDTGAIAGSVLLGNGVKGTSQLVIDDERRVVVGATFTGPSIVGELLHSATIAVVGEVPVDTLWHAVPSFPTVSEVWLRLLEAYGL